MRCLYLPLVATLALSACATPRESCVAGAQRELRVLSNLVNETRANLARGYALNEVREVVTVRRRCSGRAADGSTFRYDCPEQRTRTRNEPVAINVSEERAKLDQLLARQAAQQRASNAAVQQCVAIHPE